MTCVDDALRGLRVHLGADQWPLQRLDEAQLPALLAIESRSHAFPWTQTHLRDSLQKHLCVGLRGPQGWDAYAVLALVAGEAELLLFVIDRPWQGRGLGGAFLRCLLQALVPCAQTVFLEVRPSNTAAVALYEAVGFNQVGVRPNYYPASSGRREDAWLYALDLAAAAL